MAFDKSKIVDKLDYASNDVNFYLICLYLWQNKSNNMNHWKQELRDALYRTYRFTGTKKLPTFEQLNNWYLKTQIEDIDDNTKQYIQNTYEKEYIRAEEKNIPLPILPEYDLNKIKEYMKEYYNWLYHQISMKAITISEVSNEIDLLIEKYK